MHTRSPYPSALRVSGRLTADARLVPSTGAVPHAFLFLHFSPAAGVPYRARVDLGTDLADHMAAEALLPNLRRGATVSVGGSALALRTERGAALLSVQDARHVLVLQDPLQEPTPPTPSDAAVPPAPQPAIEVAHAH